MFNENLIDIQEITPEKFLAVIEISQGSNQKYEIDHKTGLLKLDRILYGSQVYPANYGFIPKTLSEDGDPLDVLVICSQPLANLSLVECRPLGLIPMIDNGESDEKIIAVATKDPYVKHYQDLKDLPPHFLKVLTNFFSSYKVLENKTATTGAIKSQQEAQTKIKEALTRYQNIDTLHD